MDYESSFNIHGNLLIYTFEGEFNSKLFFEDINRVVQLSKELDIKHLICNLLKIEKMYSGDLLTSETRRLAIASKLINEFKDLAERKVAVVSSKEDYNGFVEYLVRKEGFNYKIFHSLNDAKKWIEET